MGHCRWTGKRPPLPQHRLYHQRCSLSVCLCVFLLILRAAICVTLCWFYVFYQSFMTIKHKILTSPALFPNGLLHKLKLWLNVENIKYQREMEKERKSDEAWEIERERYSCGSVWPSSSSLSCLPPSPANYVLFDPAAPPTHLPFMCGRLYHSLTTVAASSEWTVADSL